MLQFSFAAHDFLYLYKHIHLSLNKPNFHFKGKGRVSTNGFNIINLSILQFNVLNFQIKQFIIFQKFSWNFVQPIWGVIVNLAEIRQLSFLQTKTKKKTITQKQWKIHAKSVEGNVLRLCFVLRTPKRNIGRTRNERLFACFYHIGRDFKVV